MDSPDYEILHTSLQEEPLRILQELFDANDSEYKDGSRTVVTELTNEVRKITSSVLDRNAENPALTTIADPSDLSHLPSRLSQLSLRGYRIDELPADFGAAVPHLVILNITGAGLRHVPPSIGKLRKLQALRLDNNRLTALPPTIRKLRELFLLNLDANPDIVEIPSAAMRLPRLYHISMRGCSVRTVPREIQNLSGSLGKLNLHGNNLRGEWVAWDELSRIPELRTLILSENPIWGIPSSFGGTFPSLRTLDLSNANLLQFPSAVLTITTLLNLMIAGNYIRSVPPEISQLTQLKHLDISHMPTLRELPNNISNMSNLDRVLISRFNTEGGRMFAETNARLLQFLRVTNLLVEIHHS